MNIAQAAAVPYGSGAAPWPYWPLESAGDRPASIASGLRLWTHTNYDVCAARVGARHIAQVIEDELHPGDHHLTRPHAQHTAIFRVMRPAEQWHAGQNSDSRADGRDATLLNALDGRLHQMAPRHPSSTLRSEDGGPPPALRTGDEGDTVSCPPAARRSICAQGPRSACRSRSPSGECHCYGWSGCSTRSRDETWPPNGAPHGSSQTSLLAGSLSQPWYMVEPSTGVRVDSANSLRGPPVRVPANGTPALALAGTPVICSLVDGASVHHAAVRMPPGCRDILMTGVTVPLQGSAADQNATPKTSSKNECSSQSPACRPLIPYPLQGVLNAPCHSDRHALAGHRTHDNERARAPPPAVRHNLTALRKPSDYFTGQRPQPSSLAVMLPAMPRHPLPFADSLTLVRAQSSVRQTAPVPMGAVTWHPQVPSSVSPSRTQGWDASTIDRSIFELKGEHGILERGRGQRTTGQAGSRGDVPGTGVVRDVGARANPTDSMHPLSNKMSSLASLEHNHCILQGTEEGRSWERRRSEERDRLPAPVHDQIRRCKRGSGDAREDRDGSYYDARSRSERAPLPREGCGEALRWRSQRRESRSRSPSLGYTKRSRGALSRSRSPLGGRDGLRRSWRS